MSVTQVYLTRCPVGNATEIALQKGWLFEDLRQAGGELALPRDLPPANWESHFTHDQLDTIQLFFKTSVYSTDYERTNSSGGRQGAGRMEKRGQGFGGRDPFINTEKELLGQIDW